MKGHGYVVALLIIAGFASAPAAYAQSDPAFSISKPTVVQTRSPFSLEFRSTYDIPIGEATQYFSAGASLDLGLGYSIPRTIFAAMGGLEYGWLPIKANASVSAIAIEAGGGIQLPIAAGLGARAYALGGYCFDANSDFSKTGNGPYVAGGLGIKIELSRNLSLNVGGQYKNYLMLYQSASVAASLEIALSGAGGSVDLPSVDLQPAFPVFFKYYDDHPIGTLRVKSNLKVPVSDIRIQVYIKEYMDSPKVADVPGTLAPGESKSVDLYALFTDKLLSITEGTKVATEITVSYSVDGKSYQDRRIETLSLWGRNAMTWDDNRKAAAYVTSKDPGVLNFARGVSSYIRSKESRAICDNLVTAMAFHEALDLYGLNYSPNPKTPYEEVSKQKDAVDFLQFPKETFQYKAGDCSDLSILYASLFEAVGIDAAFITIPGHIFIAFDTALATDQAPRELIPTSQFIAYKNRAWVPIEVTDIHNGFVDAWQLGAKEWTENKAKDLAGFYPVSEAWIAYQPVGLPGAEVPVAVPQSDSIQRAYLAEARKYLDAGLAPAVAKLQAQIKSSGSVAAMNNLGVLYAKYGDADKAEQQFKQASAKQQNHLPSILNLGHLYFGQGKWKSALGYYQKASDIDPGNAHTVLALARANLELQNYAEAQQDYAKLVKLDPGLAGQFAFLGEGRNQGSRAADVGTERKLIVWESGE
jgi:hypothetical protein